MFDQGWWLIGAVLAWIGVASFVHWIVVAAPRGREDVLASGAMRLVQVYARLFHRIHAEGVDRAIAAHDSSRAGERGVIFVSNHTAGVDPLLIQAVLPFEVRWVMGADMGIPSMQNVWKFGRIIFVDRHSGSARGVRDALQHLRHGGVLGVFAEGHIERPAQRILPFQTGVGLLIKRSGAMVVPVVIEGTPQVDPAWASLSRMSRAVVRFLQPIDYSESGLDAGAIAADLRQRFVEATGWPTNDRAPRLVNGEWEYAENTGGNDDDPNRAA